MLYRFTWRMEHIVYGSFGVLSLVAYGARQVANKSDDKKVSVSNVNFKRWDAIIIGFAAPSSHFMFKNCFRNSVGNCYQ